MAFKFFLFFKGDLNFYHEQCVCFYFWPNLDFLVEQQIKLVLICLVFFNFLKNDRRFRAEVSNLKLKQTIQNEPVEI